MPTKADAHSPTVTNAATRARSVRARVTDIERRGRGLREVASVGRQDRPAQRDAEALLRRVPLQLGLAIRRGAAELVVCLPLWRDVDERGTGVDPRAPAVEALVAVDDLEVLARAGAEHVDADDPGRAAGVDGHD